MVLGIARTDVDAGPVHTIVEAQVAELQSVASGLAIDIFTVVLDEGTVVVGGVALVGHRQLEGAVDSLRLAVDLYIIELGLNIGEGVSSHEVVLVANDDAHTCLLRELLHILQFLIVAAAQGVFVVEARHAAIQGGRLPAHLPFHVACDDVRLAHELDGAAIVVVVGYLHVGAHPVGGVDLEEIDVLAVVPVDGVLLDVIVREVVLEVLTARATLMGGQRVGAYHEAGILDVGHVVRRLSPALLNGTDERAEERHVVDVRMDDGIVGADEDLVITVGQSVGALPDGALKVHAATAVTMVIDTAKARLGTAVADAHEVVVERQISIVVLVLIVLDVAADENLLAVGTCTRHTGTAVERIELPRTVVYQFLSLTMVWLAINIMPLLVRSVVETTSAIAVVTIRHIGLAVHAVVISRRRCAIAVERAVATSIDAGPALA